MVSAAMKICQLSVFFLEEIPCSGVGTGVVARVAMRPRLF